MLTTRILSFGRFRQWMFPIVGALAISPFVSAQDVSDNEYLIGPGDMLQVFVWRQEDLSVTVPVRPDGRISTPLVEDLVAVGKTPSQLGEDIEEVLSEFYTSPEVTIVVQSFEGAYQSQVRVIGEVVNPGSYQYQEGMTVFDVVVDAGGLTPYARSKKGRLVRGEGSDSEEFGLRLDRLMEDGDLSENMRLQPGDTIIVPQAIF